MEAIPTSSVEPSNGNSTEDEEKSFSVHSACRLIILLRAADFDDDDGDARRRRRRGNATW